MADLDEPVIETRPPIWTALSGAMSATAGAIGLRSLRPEIEGLATQARCGDAREVAVALDGLIRIGRRARGSEAWDEIALVFDRLDDEQREAAMRAGRSFWPEACQRLGTSSSSICRAAAARIAGYSDDPEVILELPALLSDREEEVAQSAADALQVLIRRGRSGIGLTPAARQALHAAVAEGVVAYERHRRREALGAAMDCLGTPAEIRSAPSALRSFLLEADHPAHLSMRSVIRQSRGGQGAGDEARAWIWMAYPAFQSACADRLGRIGANEALSDVLARGHLLANPARREAMDRTARQPKREAGGQAGGLVAGMLALDEVSLPEFPLNAARRAPEFVKIGFEAGKGVERLGALMTDDRPTVRWAVARALVTGAKSDVAVLETLADLCFDTDESVATTALLGLDAARLGRAEKAQVGVWIGKLQRTDHPRVRALATLSRGRHEPWVVDDASSRLLARKMARRDRSALIESIRDRLADVIDAQSKVRTVLLIERLRLVQPLEADLLGLVRNSREPGGSGDGRERDSLFAAAASAAVLARSGVDGGVSAALSHTDARVRANAIDGLAWRARRTPGGARATDAAAIVELKCDDHHRVRASAVRAELLIRAAESNGEDTSVLPLLTDRRPMHRIAGLWLTERVSAESPRGDWNRLTSAVAGMIEHDASPEVRVRARRCAQRILTRARIGWAGA